MPALVPLQEPFSYSLWPIVLCLFVIVLLTCYMFVPVLKQKRKEIKVKKEKPYRIVEIKEKYLSQLDQLEKMVKDNHISIRHAYQKVSMTIRQFVNEITGIKVQNCTLQDIEKLNMPLLTELMKEYYEPEFSEKSGGNIKNSIQKTRMVIEKWS